MPIHATEQRPDTRLAIKYILPTLPSQEQSQELVKALLSDRLSTESDPKRKYAIYQINSIAKIAASHGVSQTNPEICIEILSEGGDPFYFRPVPSDTLIAKGIIEQPQTIALVQARQSAKEERQQEGVAENSMVVWALDEREKDLLIQIPPDVKELLASIKSSSQKRTHAFILDRTELEERKKGLNESPLGQLDKNEPIIALRESYTITIPPEAISAKILEEFEKDQDQLEHLEIDVKGLFVIGTLDGRKEVVFLGQEYFPHQHFTGVPVILRFDITNGMDLQFIEAACKSIGIPFSPAPDEKFLPQLARNEQLAAIFTLLMESTSMDFNQ